MITITLTFRTVEAARQALLEIPASALVGGPAEPAAPAESGGYFNKLFDAEAAAAKPAPKAPKAKPAPAPVVVEAAPVVVEAAPVVVEQPKATTSEEVRAFLAPFLRDADNVAKVQSLLKEFDAPRLSSIPSEKLADFLTKAQEVFA